MSRKLEFLRTLLRMLFQLLFVLMLTHVYYVGYVDKPIEPECIGTIMFYFLLAYTLDFFARSLLLKLAFHLGMIISAIAIPYVIEVKVLLIIVVLCITNITVGRQLFKKKRVESRKTPVPIGYMIVVFFMNLYAYSQGDNSLIRTCNILPIVMLFIFLAQVYLDGLGNYIDQTNSITGVPIKRIVFTNTTFVGGIIFALLVVVVLLNIFGVDGSSIPIWRGLSSACLLLFFGILYLFGSFMNKFTDDSKDGLAYTEAARVLKEDGTNKLGEVLEMLLYVAIIAAVIYVLYKMIFMFAKILLSRKQNEFDNIERAEAIAEAAEQRESTNTKYEAQSSEEEKIRKLYKNRILKQKHFLEPTEYKTAREYEQAARAQEIGDIKEITDLYTSVRYGNGTVDKTTVKEMKELLKK